MTELTKNLGQNLKSLFSPLRTFAATASLLSLAAPSASGAGLTEGSTFMLFLECNNDGIFHVVENSPLASGWEYTVDAVGDNTDGDAYDIGGIAFKQEGNELFVAITGGTPLGGTGYDRNLQQILYGDLLVAPPGVNFQDAMEKGKLSAVHFSGSEDSGANEGLGLYKNVAAKGVGVHNFGHSSHENYANIVNSDVDNFFGDLGLENDYFNKNKGYNVIAEGTKVENDGFKLLDTDDLKGLGLNLAKFGDSPTTETFGFKFNIDALFPPQEPKGIGVLEGIAGEAEVTFEESWKEDIAGIDQNINDFQDEADKQQGIANAEQVEADKQQAIRDKAEAERKRIQKEEMNPRNKENNTAIETSPGASGYLKAKAVRDNLKDLEDNIKKAQKVIDNNPAKIAQATQERDAAKKALDEIPSEEDYLSNKKDNADQRIKDAYPAVEDLTPQKEAWEQYKIDQGYDRPWKWNQLSTDEKLAVQDSFPGEWIALRQNGSASKQEQELEAFSKAIEDFEKGALRERRQETNRLQNIVNRRNSSIKTYNTEITGAQKDKDKAQTEIAKIQNNGKRDLVSDLNTLKQNAEDALNNLGDLTPAQRQERENFYNEEIAQLQKQIEDIEDKNLEESLNYLGNSKNKNGYYKQHLATAIKLDNRQVLDENGQPEFYTAADFKVEVPVYDNEGNQIRTEPQDIQPKEYYYNDKGKLRDRPVDLVGQPKTVASEYTLRQIESSTYKGIKDDDDKINGLKKISDNAKTAKNAAVNAKEDALKAREDALTDKDQEIEAKNDRLLQIEEAILAVQNERIMAERLEVTAAAEAEEKALEEKYGVRTEDNFIPLTTEEVAQLNQVPEASPNENENSVQVPEPSGIAGLFAVGLALVSGKFRKKNKLRKC